MTALVTTLEEDEAVIERGLGTFREVGEALLRIRDGRKYLQTADANGEMFSTFEDYCQERWGMTPQHANRTIAAAEIAGVLEPIGSATVPTTESQARALAPLRSQPEKMAEAMSAAAEASDGRPTAAAITRAVERMVEESVPASAPRPVAEVDAARRRSEANGRAIRALRSVDEAVDEARSEGNLSRANVVREIRG